MQVRALKYATPLIFFAGAFFSFTSTGWIIFLPLLYAWGFIPLFELLVKPDDKNLDQAEEEMARRDFIYDVWLYVVVIFQYAALYLFLQSMVEPGLMWWEAAGRIFVMGLLCGTFGINVAHELGHRKKPFEQFLAKMLLLTSLYMHFFIEHNKGHHKHVSTPEDPSSARYGESLYAFYVRSVVLSYLSAWRIANREQDKKGLPAIHYRNEMLQFQLIQLAFLLLIIYFFGLMACFFFMAAAVIGFLQLETVNYIEHYGLSRLKAGRR